MNSTEPSPGKSVFEKEWERLMHISAKPTRNMVRGRQQSQGFSGQEEPLKRLKERQEDAYKQSELLFLLDLEGTYRELGLGPTLSYESFLDFLMKMKFVNEELDHPKHLEEQALVKKAWTLISTDDEALKDNLFTFLLCLMNLCPGSQETPRSISSLGTMKNGKFTATEVEVLRIHKYFWMLYVNRNLNQSICKGEEVKNEKKHKKWRKVVEKSSKNRNIALYELSKFSQRKEGPTTEEINMQACLSECSFKPKISRPSTSSNINDVVERLSKPKYSPPKKKQTGNVKVSSPSKIVTPQFSSPLAIAKGLIKNG